MAAESSDGRQRDASSLRVLALFFSVLGGVVLIATLWTLDKPRAAVVNAVSGGILASVGVGMMLTARRLSATTSET